MCNWTAWWFNPERGNSAQEVAETLAEMAVNALYRPERRQPESVSLDAALGILREDLDYIERLIKS